MQTEHVRTLVIGAGLSGLCAALALGGDCLVLEREADAGGCCRSIRRDGFVWDYAGHFFHFRSEAGRRFFLSFFEPDELIEADKRSQILYRGARIDAPFQAHLAQLDKQELIDCLWALHRRREKNKYGSFLELLYGSFGAAITDKFLRPYNEKLYACGMDELDAGAMGRFFPALSEGEILDSLRCERSESYNSRFFAPKEGAQTLIERLCGRLPAGCLRLGTQLRTVDMARRLAIDSDGRQYRYESLVNTAPLPHFLRLLGTPEAAALSGSLRANQVLVLNLGFAGPAPSDRPHWIYIPGPEARFYRVGYYDALYGGRASLYVELAFPDGAAVDAERERETALADLRRLGLIQPDNPLLAFSALRMEPAYVHLRPGTEERVRGALAMLAKAGIYSIGRYGGWRYCSMEDCMREAAALGEGLRAGGAA